MPSVAEAQSNPGSRRVTLREVNRLGGGLNGLVGDERFLYAGMGASLLVFDLSDPDAPRRIAQSAAAKGSIQDLVQQGDLILASLSPAGIAVFDVSEPSSPQIRSHLPIPASEVTDLVLAGSRAYLAAQDVYTLSLEPPGRLEIIARHFVPGGAIALQQVDASLYVLGGGATIDGRSFLSSLTVLDPGSGRLLRMHGLSLPFPTALNVDAEGQRALVSDRGSLAFYELRTEVYAYQTGIVHGHFERIHRLGQTIIGAGHYGIAVARAQSNGGLLLAGKQQHRKGSASGLWVQADRAYMSHGAQGLSVHDVSSPTLLRPLIGPAALGSARIMAVDGQRAALISSDLSLGILDLASPAQPQLLGRLLSADRLSSALSIRGNMLAFSEWPQRLGNETVYPIRLYDISQVDAARHLARILLDSYVYDLQIHGGLLYVLTRDQGLISYDLVDPGMPAPIGSLQTSWANLDLEIDPRDPSRAYLLGDRGKERSGGLASLSLADPAKPSVTGMQETGTQLLGNLALRGGLALGTGATSSQLFDISAPDRPLRLPSAGLPISSSAFGGAFLADDLIAFMVAGDASLLAPASLVVIDIADPAAPREVGRLDFSAMAYAPRQARLQVVGDHLLVPAGELGLISVAFELHGLAPPVPASPTPRATPGETPTATPRAGGPGSRQPGQAAIHVPLLLGGQP